MSDRRYRQRGYRDDGGDRDGRRKRGPRPPQPRKEGPRGRGMGAPTETVFRCPSCNTLSLEPRAEDFEAVCSKCGEGLHACVACAHFDPSATYECRQEIVERVPRKRENNACTLYTAKTKVEFERGDKLDPAEARAAFENLFDL